MGWLDERVLKHLYRKKAGEEIVAELEAGKDLPAKVKGYIFVETLPYKVHWTLKVQFERNGLVAYRYDNGDGKPRTVSATRENYEKNLGNMPAHEVQKLKKERRL